MAAPIVETIWLVNDFKRHIVIAVTAPSSVQNLMNSSSRRFNGKSRSLDDQDYRMVKILCFGLKFKNLKEKDKEFEYE